MWCILKYPIVLLEEEEKPGITIVKMAVLLAATFDDIGGIMKLCAVLGTKYYSSPTDFEGF